jgi:hypothetical protein
MLRDYAVQVKVLLGIGQDLLIDVTVTDSQGRIQGRLRRVGRKYRINGSPPRFVPVLELIDQVATDSFECIRMRVRGLEIEIAIQCHSKESPHQAEHGGMPDLRPLRAPMVDLWGRPLESGRDKIEAWSERLTVSLGAEPVISYCDDNRRRAKSREVRGAASESVRAEAAAVYRSNPAAIEEGIWSVFVTGQALGGRGD